MAGSKTETEKRKDAAQAALGTGMAASAAKDLRGRKSHLDYLENEAMGVPKPLPSEGQQGQADRSKYNWDTSGPKRY